MSDSTTRLGFRVDDLEQTINSILEIGEKIKSKVLEAEFGAITIVNDFDGKNIKVYQK